MKNDFGFAKEMQGALACIELIHAIRFPVWFRTMVLSADSLEDAAERVVSEAEGRLRRGGALPDWLTEAFDSAGFEHTFRMDPLSNPVALVRSLELWIRRAKFLGITSKDDPNFRRLLDLRETRVGNKDRIDEWWRITGQALEIT